MTERQMRTVYIYQGYPPNWMDEYGNETNLPALKTWLDEQIGKIPPEYRETARFGVNSVSEWWEAHYAEITITYRRPETDAEMAGRQQRQTDWVENRQTELRRELSRLEQHE